MTDGSFLCIDRVPDLVLTDVVKEVSVAVNPANRRVVRTPSGLEAAGEPEYYWPPGTTLRVRFLDGDPELRHEVMAAARVWLDYANLEFAVVESGEAEIRITFVGKGNWSARGTTARATEMFPAHGPTMCLTEVPVAQTPERLARVARHEFGHAIGLIHEHSSPLSGMEWNKPVVLEELGGPPNNWEPADVDFNVFMRYETTTTQYTEFDPASVMLYSFPPHWTLNGVTFPENTELSAMDKAFVAKIYPGRP